MLDVDVRRIIVSETIRRHKNVGDWQVDFFLHPLSGRGWVTNPIADLVGLAAKYSSSYVRSLTAITQTLREVAQEHLVELIILPGPAGGTGFHARTTYCLVTTHDDDDF